MTRPALSVATLAILALTTTTAAAQDGDEQKLSIAIGPGIALSPRYPGADDLRVLPIPALDLRYGHIFFGSGGLGVNLVQDKAAGLTAGVSVFFRGDRDESDDPVRLRGLGDIGTAVQGRIFASKQLGSVTARAVLAHDFGGSGGTTLDLGATLNHPLGQSVFLFGGPSLGIASAKFNQAFFGISDEQVLRGNRAPYDLDAGVYQVGASLGVRWIVDRRWSATAIGSADYLLGDAGDSPVIATRWQPGAALFVAYRF
jgi:outer membrane scaffolding protein for murein synthesis (MipA/OmpV family)|tara:strand:+ start:8978 stop:9748 length:771 start_codon:yes stop_codon:yes gene_type:complete